MLRKRPRHDSQSEVEEYGQEDLLTAKVRQELAEEEALKHLTEEQIMALLDQADAVRN